MHKVEHSTSRIIRPLAAAEFLGISKTGLYRLVNKSLLKKPIKLGIQASGWTEQSLLDFIKERQNAK